MRHRHDTVSTVIEELSGNAASVAAAVEEQNVAVVAITDNIRKPRPMRRAAPRPCVRSRAPRSARRHRQRRSSLAVDLGNEAERLDGATAAFSTRSARHEPPSPPSARESPI